MAEPIRVAHVMGKMVGGGLEAVVMNYYRHVDRTWFQFDLLVDSDSTFVPRDEVESLGRRIIEVPPYQDILENQRVLTSLFRQEGWIIVHSHMNALSVFPLHAAYKAGVPIRIAHSHSTSGRGEFVRNAMKAVLKTQANRYPTDKVACSKLAGDWLFGKGSKYTIVRNAIDLGRFASNESSRHAVRNELSVAGDDLLIGHIGRFVEQKNHAFLFDIFKEVLVSEPNAVLALAGEGPLLKAAKDRVRALGIEDSVRFLGQRDDSAELYRAFDVFCLPSLYEGLPMVGVECQASGTPILASDAVTREAAMTSLMEFESLDSTPEAWARHLLSMCGRTFADGDAEGLSGFDIRHAAAHLQSHYYDLISGVQHAQ